MRTRILLPCLILLAAAPLASAVDVTPLRPLPTLDHGRVKPLDTLARETVRFVTGSEFFGPVTTDADGSQTITNRADPIALLLDWASHPVYWQTQPVLYVPLLDLRAKLHMQPPQEWIAPQKVMEQTDFTAWVHKIEQDRVTADQNKETIFINDPTEKRLEDAAVELDNRLSLFESATDLSLYCVLPNNGPKSNVWLPISVIKGLTGNDAQIVQPITAAWAGVLDAYQKNDDAAFANASNDLISSISQLVGGGYADTARIDREVFYNSFKPFRWAWIIYFLAAICLIASLMSRRTIVYTAAMGVYILAIGFHAGAFALRCSITGWAPVTNMYETVIWVAMMGAIFALVLELIYRRRVIAIGGVIVALLATIVADNMPPEWGNSIRNLTPVLRSNYWLTIHVLTIVSSYAAFALALILGNIVLGQYIHGGVAQETIRTNLLFIYRAVQIGVLLVATGTILGGMWADVSWGRFWGWDPKEVWALIVLLTYLALLHGRYAGWIKQFGLAVGAVMCFTAVLMSWYGVNFVLGAGLHSYGFNTGGQGYVYTFVAIQWAYVLTAWIIHRRRIAHPRTAQEILPRGVPVTGK